MISLGEEIERVGNYLFGGSMNIAHLRLEVVALEKPDDNSPRHLTVIAQGPEMVDNMGHPFAMSSITFQCNRNDAPEIGDFVDITVLKETHNER